VYMCKHSGNYPFNHYVKCVTMSFMVSKVGILKVSIVSFVLYKERIVNVLKT
jgi:hypothetical protein